VQWLSFSAALLLKQWCCTALTMMLHAATIMLHAAMLCMLRSAESNALG
jgi:hypothetical protein